MLKKSFLILKNNPVLILLYLGSMLLIYLIMYGLYPHDYNQMSQTYVTSFDFAEYMITMLKMMLAALLMSVVSLLFYSGFGFMMNEAVITGKTNISSMPTGIKKFTIRILLAYLLYMAFAIGFSIVIGITMIPFIILATVKGVAFIIIYVIVLMLLITAVIPLLMLWMPAIFADNCSAMQGLKRGWKAGFKNYWKLVLIVVVNYLPVAIYMVFNYSSMSSGNIFNLGYLLVIIISSIISLIISPMLFILYYEKRQVPQDMVMQY